MKSVITFSIILILIPLKAYALDNTPLTTEQTNEIEKDPIQIISNCINRIDSKLDVGNLCDGFATYLKNKCERLDNLGNYCGLVLSYNSKRETQKLCELT